jgi:type II secretion system protein J
VREKRPSFAHEAGWRFGGLLRPVSLRSTGEGGFTLIEVMLAVLVLAMMMSVVYGVVIATVETSKRLEEITAASEIGPAILSRMREDLEAAFLPREGDWFAATDRKGSSGDRDRIDFVSAVLAFGADREGDEPRFHGVNEVGYQVLDSKTEAGAGVLYRREDYFLDAEPLRGGRLIEMYDRVTHFDLQYWDGEQWRPDWSTRLKDSKLPKAVRIELKIRATERGDREVERSFTSIVTLPN